VTQSRAAMLIMLVAVLCFFVGDWFTVQAAKSLTVNQTLFIRLLIGLIAVYGFLFYRRKKVVYQNVFSSVVLLRSIAYTFAIYCFAASFAISEEMTSVYVISLSMAIHHVLHVGRIFVHSRHCFIKYRG
jgi:hypothetical protein